MSHLAIAAIGPDKPGIVSAVSATLLQLRCNLEDISTSVLRGQFTMVVIAQAPDDVNANDLTSQLALLEQASLLVSVWAITDAVVAAEATHMLTVYGPDTTGIVHAVSSTLASEGVNITDMVCRLHDGDPSVYVVTTEVVVPDGVDPERVAVLIGAACAQMGLDCSFTPILTSRL
jgi:glycine cleavage system transcriptional repressor